MINLKALLGLEYYTSELDDFLQQYNKNHPRLSASQQAEYNKYQLINQLRDYEKSSL